MKMSKSKKIIGIDLGTTNSCVAVMEGKSPRILENPEGGRTTPSVVAFPEDAGSEVLVGQMAKNKAVINPKNTLYAVKRLIGRRFDDEEVQRDIKIVPYSIVRANKNNDAWIEVNGDRKSPPEISARVLQKMKRTAEEYLGEKVESAVITVPAYFNDSQRQATKDAGIIAGLDIKRIINEPTAAALAYGMEKRDGDLRVAIYDLGGGTFDISIIEMSEIDGEQQVEVKSTNGDTSLGGEDFDNRIIDHLCGEFKKNHGIDPRNSDNLRLRQEIKEAAEKAKIELSFSQQADIDLDFIDDTDGLKHFEIKLTRAKLESLIEDLINRTKEPCLIAMEDANISASDIDEVILVGGQTRMPKVQEVVESIFGKKPRKNINPDEAVALGAAIQGGILAGNIKDMVLLDCTSLSLGIETLGGVMTTVIRKNTMLPAKESQIFTTVVDNQPAVNVHVLQGEREKVEDNISLRRFDLEGIPQAPRGTPQIEVTFDMDANGILDVSAQDKATGKEQSVRISARSGLSPEEIDRMIDAGKAHADEDREFYRLTIARNNADSLIHNTEKLFSRISNQIGGSEKIAIKKAISELEAVLNGTDRSTIELRTKTLSDLFDSLADRADSRSQSDDEYPNNGSNRSGSKRGESSDVIDAEFDEGYEDAKSDKERD